MRRSSKITWASEMFNCRLCWALLRSQLLFPNDFFKNLHPFSKFPQKNSENNLFIYKLVSCFHNLWESQPIDELTSLHSLRGSCVGRPVPGADAVLWCCSNQPQARWDVFNIINVIWLWPGFLCLLTSFTVTRGFASLSTLTDPRPERLGFRSTIKTLFIGARCFHFWAQVVFGFACVVVARLDQRPHSLDRLDIMGWEPAWFLPSVDTTDLGWFWHDVSRVVSSSCVAISRTFLFEPKKKGKKKHST